MQPVIEVNIPNVTDLKILPTVNAPNTFVYNHAPVTTATYNFLKILPDVNAPNTYLKASKSCPINRTVNREACVLCQSP